MSLDRNQVFTCAGVAVRMAARRADGKVLVEYLNPRTHEPLESWRVCWPHDLRALRSGVTIAHIKALAVILPLARFAHDGREPVEASPAPSGGTAGSEFWWNKT